MTLSNEVLVTTFRNRSNARPDTYREMAAGGGWLASFKDALDAAPDKDAKVDIMRREVDALFAANPERRIRLFPHWPGVTADRP